MKDEPDERPDAGDGSAANVTTETRVPPEAEWSVVVQTPTDRDGRTGLTSTILSANADAEGIEPKDVKSPPLYEVVDAAALEAAFFGGYGDPRPDDPNMSTEFMYRDFRVTVTSDGWVTVSERVD